MEEERITKPTPDNTDQGLVKSPRDALPAYYSVKIESFSKLVQLKIEKYESATFHASGFNWRLVLYPNGNTKKGCEGHISMYLAIDKTDTLPLGWEVYVTLKMFVFNHQTKKYLAIPEDSEHQIQRFHQENKESGFDRLIALDNFNAARTGYLINDSCVFGVQVYDVKCSGNIGEALKIIENPNEVTFDWRIRVGSAVCNEELHSQEFLAGKHKWRLRLNCYEDQSKDRSSLYLELTESPSTVKKVLAEYSVGLGSCHQYKGMETSGYKWFSTEELTTDGSSRWEIPEFQLRDFKVPKGKKARKPNMIIYILKVRAKVNVKAEVTNFS